MSSLSSYYEFIKLSSPAIAGLSCINNCKALSSFTNKNFIYNYDSTYFLETTGSEIYAIWYSIYEDKRWSFINLIDYKEIYYNLNYPFPDVAPLTGWVSLCANDTPAPIFTLSSNIESFFSGNNYGEMPPIQQNDFVCNNNFTILCANSSSTLIPKISVLRINCLSLTSLNSFYLSSLSTIYIKSNSFLKDLDFSKNLNLREIDLSDNKMLSSCVLSSKNIRSFYIENSILSSKNIDNYFFLLNDNFINGNKPNSFIYNSNVNYRTSATNYEFFNLYKNNVILSPIEYDALTVNTPPSTYVPSSLLGNTTYILNPVSSNNNTIIRYQQLSGSYVKVPNVIKNNRDVFKNNYDFYISYENINDLWTLVGPGSASSTVWLSAIAGIGDWGNPPNFGWRGIGFSNPSTASNRWFQSTRILHSQTLAYSGIKYQPYYGNANNLMILYDPSEGINNNFKWKNLDFTGRVFSNGSIYMSHQGGGAMISPIHFTYSIHYPPWNRPYNSANNDILRIYNTTGNYITALALSSQGVGGDIGIGIFSNPVSGVNYKLLSGNFYNFLNTFNDVNNVIYGPNQYGCVGVAFPVYYNGLLDFFTENSGSLNFNNVYSISKSDVHGGTVITGDSSCNMFVISGNELLLVSHALYGGNKATGFYYGNFISTLLNNMTSLNKHFYNNPYIYSFSAVSFPSIFTSTPTPTPTQTPSFTPTPSLTPYNSLNLNVIVYRYEPKKNYNVETVRLSASTKITNAFYSNLNTKTEPFVPILTPTITPTRTATPNPTPSHTPTRSATPTVTPTCTLTPSVTLTQANLIGWFVINK